MEIKRLGDSFIVKLNGKRISLYWNRNFDFGENLIRRACERITTEELNLLVDVIDTANKNIAAGEKPTKEQLEKLHQALAAVGRIIHWQTGFFFKVLPTEKFNDFVNACYPLMFRSSMRMLNKLYGERYNGCECDLERKVNDAESLSDWLVTRHLVSRFVANELVALFKLCMCETGGQMIKELLTFKQPFALDSGTFIIQLFKTQPCLHDFDKRNMADDLRLDFIKKIKSLHKEICGYKLLENTNTQKELVGLNDNETDTVILSDYIESLWFTIRKDIELLRETEQIERVGQLINLLEAFITATPRTTILGERLPYTKTDEERRNIVLDIFKYWDNNLPDDITIMKEERELREAIEKQKKELVDKADKEYVGKTQDEINAERKNNGIVLEVKDEDGSVVSEAKL